MFLFFIFIFPSCFSAINQTSMEAPAICEQLLGKWCWEQYPVHPDLLLKAVWEKSHESLFPFMGNSCNYTVFFFHLVQKEPTHPLTSPHSLPTWACQVYKLLEDSISIWFIFVSHMQHLPEVCWQLRLYKCLLIQQWMWSKMLQGGEGTNLFTLPCSQEANILMGWYEITRKENPVSVWTGALSYLHGKGHKCSREHYGLESSGMLHARGESWRIDRTGVGGEAWWMMEANGEWGGEKAR